MSLSAAHTSCFANSVGAIMDRSEARAPSASHFFLARSQTDGYLQPGRMRTIR